MPDISNLVRGSHQSMQEDVKNTFLQVAQRYAAIVAPFLKSCPRTAVLLPPGNESTQALYMWATAIISSYSFSVGDDRQALLFADHHLTQQVFCSMESRMAVLPVCTFCMGP